MEQNFPSKSNIGHAVVWSFAAELAAKILVPITNIILARILAPDAFGVIATITMIVSFADMLSTSGVSQYVIQREFKDLNELYENADVAFWTNIFVAVFGWLIIYIFRTQLCDLVGNSGYEVPLIVAALSLPLTAFSCVQEAIFQRFLNYKALFYRRCVVSVLPFFVTIPLALFGLGYWSLIIGTLAGNIAKIVILSFYSPWQPKFYYSWAKLHRMFSFCTWMLLVSISSWGITYIDVFMVSNKMGEYYTGLYKNSQVVVVGILTIITAATSSVLFSSLSRVQSNASVFQDMLFSFQRKVCILLLPLGIGLFCFSDLVTHILLGEQWMEASPFIGAWGLCTTIFSVFGDFSKDACKAKGKPQLVFFVQILHIAFLIPIFQWAIDFGFETFGYIRSVAYLEIVLLYFIAIWFYIQVSPLKMIKNIGIPAFCAALMGILAYYLLNAFPAGFLVQFVYVIVCAIFYFVLLSMFKSYRNFVFMLLKSVKEKLPF